MEIESHCTECCECIPPEELDENGHCRNCAAEKFLLESVVKLFEEIY